MKPVMQTILGDGGNCFPACVASILEIPDELNVITKALSSEGDWTEQELLLNKWLRSRGMISIPFLPWEERCNEFIHNVTCIAGGVSSRNRQHAVVWRNELIHDPFPGGNGLIGVPETFSIIFPLIDH